MSFGRILQYTESDRIAILKDYGKTPESLKVDIQSVKEWMAKQAHLPEIADDNLIERFFLLNKCRIEIAKQKLDTYYTVRSILPELYDKSPTSPEIQKCMDVVYVITLPKLTPELYRVTVIKLKDTNPDNFDAAVFVAYIMIIVDIRLREDYNRSEIQIIDLAGATLSHLLKFNPLFVQKCGFIVNKLLSNRLKGIYFINAPTFSESFVYLLKIILKPKLIERVQIHRDSKTLHTLVPKEILPNDFGGAEKSLDELNEEWKRKLVDSEKLLDHMRTLKVNEDLRAEKSLLDDHLGVEGSFRKLEID